jgi:DNA-binding transcriptional regulator GbsR (MarR family)
MAKKNLSQQIIAEFAEGYRNFGLNPLMGRIVGLLIISPEPQSLDDMVEKLEMSKGPISQICRRLKDHGLIEKVWIPGDRKDYYETVDDIFGKAYANQIGKMHQNKEIAEKFIAKTDSIKTKEAKYVTKKMEIMNDFYKMMDEYNKKFLKAWHDHQSNKNK